MEKKFSLSSFSKNLVYDSVGMIQIEDVRCGDAGSVAKTKD